MNLWFDFHYALRLLRKSWGYSLVCAAVVALSVGLALWSYLLAWSQVWKPLPFEGSDRWYSVQIAADAKARAFPAVDAYTWQELVANNRSADVLGAFASRVAVLGDGQASTSLRAAAITPRLLASTRVAPLLGRTFHDGDGHDGAAAVAIISFETWHTYFAADPNIIGRTVRLDAAPAQIVGVMPQDFIAFANFELWQPLHLPRLARPRDSNTTLSPIVVLKQNVDVVQKEMQTVVARVNREHPDLFHSARHVEIFPARRIYNHANTPIVSMIGFLAAGVLLLGCVNISMMFFARLLERSRELALRTALGASRPRLLRQCLIETAMIVFTGLLGGCGFALLGVDWTASISTTMNRVMAAGGTGKPLELRPVDLAAAVAAAVVVWLLSTVVPALRVAKRDAATVLAGSGKGATVRTSNRSVGLLVGVQVVVSCLVLVICASLVLAIKREVGQPSGLATAGIMLTTSPTVFDTRFAQESERLRYWENLEAAIESKVAGAEVAFSTTPPIRPARASAVIESRQNGDRRGGLTLPLIVVSESYFDLHGMTLRSGRLFDRTDNDASMPVAIVDEQLVARHWPDRNVLGKRVQVNGSEWLTIVGVVSAVRGRPYRDEDRGMIYRPLRQAIPQQFHLLVRLPDGADRRAALRAAAYTVDRDLALHNLQALDDYQMAVNLSYNAIVPVIVTIAIITAILAASGLFGLISRSVVQRTQDVGIRRALGATVWRATSMFQRQGLIYLSVSIVGIVLGIMVSTLISRTFTNILDFVVPATAGVVLLMAAVIFTATYLPTRRAVALEPGDALRYE